MPLPWKRIGPAAACIGAAALGGVSTDVDSRWFAHLDLPALYPPPLTFPVVWTALYAGMGWSGGEVLTRATPAERQQFAPAYAMNLALNAAWTPLFFQAHRPWLATAQSAALTVSTVDLLRRAARVSRPAAAVLAPYAVWTAFATVLSGAIARRN